MKKQNLTTVINTIWKFKSNTVMYRLEHSRIDWAMHRDFALDYERDGDCIAYCCYLNESDIPLYKGLNPGTTLVDRIKEIANKQG